MTSVYTPTAWYWAVGGSVTQVFSSAQGAFVGVGDATYQAFLAAGNTPTQIANNSFLFDVMASAGVMSSAVAAALNAAGGLSSAQQDVALSIATNGLQNNLVARAGGGQANATLCCIGINVFTVVASPNDSAQLPAALPGRGAMVFNKGASTMSIYAKNGSTDLLHTNSSASGTSATTLASGQTAQFGCPQPGQWFTAQVTPTS